MIETVVSTSSALVRSRLCRLLEALRLRHEVLPAEEVSGVRNPNRVYLLGSGTAACLPSLPGPTVVVSYGAMIADTALVAAAASGAIVVWLEELTPATLLRAILSANLGTSLERLSHELADSELLAGVPTAVIDGFLRSPTSFTRQRDLRRVLPTLSRDRLRVTIRQCGFARAEHLCTTLRLLTWSLLVQHGVDRRATEQYLGIADRATFRRACRRAGLAEPGA